MFGLLGFDSFDLITEILQNRRTIREPSGFDNFTLDDNGATSQYDMYTDEAESRGARVPHFKSDRGPSITNQVRFLGERLK